MPEAHKYQLKYPSYLSPNKRQWVLAQGDCLSKDGILYEVTQILNPLIKGTVPRIVLKEKK